MRLVSGGLDPLKRFAFALECADLNDPSAMGHLGLVRAARLGAEAEDRHRPSPAKAMR